MKRAYKLQEFVAHSSNVNCLKIGKKSSRVLVTGGEDHKVNMWAIGKPNAILSLSGHTSAVESVTFDAAEVLVVAGAASGTIKLWDLEEAKIVRTLTGHRSNCISVDFHPFGEFFASGSLDTNLKIWDIRRKGCIHTYKGHTRGVNCLKFSPDGRWVVSGSEDNTVKLWDLTAGKIMHDFKYHDGQVLCLDFHPHEFLLATGSADKTVKFYDLETFELIGSSGPEATGVRAMTFNPDGRTLLTAMQETLKVLSWEPLRCHDMVDASWSKIADLNVHEGKLLGCSYNQSCVGVWVVDLSRVAPHQTANVKRSNSGLSGKLAPTMSQGVMSVNDINLKSSRSSATSQIESAMKDLKLETSIKDVKTSSSTKVVEPPSNSLRIGTPLSSRVSTPLSSSLSTPRKSNFSRPQTSDSVRISTRAETIPAAVVRPVDFVRPSTQSDALPSAHSNFVRPTSQSDAVPTASFVRPSSQSDVLPSSNSTFVRPSSQPDASLTPPVVLSKDNEDAVVKVGSTTSALRKQATENVNGLKNRITEELQDAKVRMDISSSVSRSSSITEKVNHGSSDLRGCEKNDATAESGEGLRKMGKMRRSISGTEGDLLSRALTGHQFLAEAGNMHHMRQSGNYEAASTNTETRFRTLSAQLDRRDRAPAIEPINGTKSFNHDTSSFMLMKNQSKLEGSEDAPLAEAHIIDQLALRHNTVANIMQSRLTKLQAVRRFWSKNDFKAAIDTMGKMADNAVVADVLSVVIEKSELFTLEIFALVIPLLNSLLESSTPRYIMVGLSTLCKLVKTFGSVIRETISSSPSIGVDLQAEKRLERCNACFRELQAVKASLIPLLRGIGESAKAAQELSIALEGL